MKLFNNFNQFCTDSCLEGKYNNFELNAETRTCLINCYKKIDSLNKMVEGEFNSFLNKHQNLQDIK